MIKIYIKIYFIFCALQRLVYSNSIDEILVESPLQPYLVDIAVTELSTGMDPIDCIYVINLDERINRWNQLRDSWKKNGLSINRVSAVNGWKLNNEVIKALSFPHKKMPGGVLGCFLSHISVLKNAYENQFNIVWVLEDDAEFVGDPQKIPELITALSILDPEWDILYTDMRNFGIRQGGFGILPVNDEDYVDENFMRPGNRFGTYSIIISKSGIEKLLHNFICESLHAPIDVKIHWTPGIRKYSTRHNIVSYVKDSISDTERPIFNDNY